MRRWRATFQTIRVSPSSWSRLDTVLVSLLFLVAVVAFSQAYERALHPLIDLGRDLYWPERMLEGAKPYRDFRYNYGPVAPYALAAFVRLFGSSLRTYAFLGFAVGLTTALALYFIGLRFSGRTSAFVGAFLFVTCSLASQRNSNFIYPFAWAATFGACAFMWFVYWLLTYLFMRRDALPFAFAVVMGLIACWSKVEFGFATAILALVVLIFYAISWRHAVSATIAALASIVGLSFYFRDASHHWITENILSRDLLSGAAAVSQQIFVAGFNLPLQRVCEVLEGAALLAAIVFLGMTIPRGTPTAFKRGLIALLPVSLLVGGVFLPHELFFRAWSLLILVVLVIVQRHRGPYFLLTVAVIVCAMRIPLNFNALGYGFALFVPAYAVIAHVLFRMLRDSVTAPSFLMRLLICFVIGIGAGSLWRQHDDYSLQRFAVYTSRGRFFDREKARADVLQQIIRHLERHPPASMVVIPEGLTLNYFARVREPLYYYIFTPVEAEAPAIEREMVTEFIDRRPQAVVFVTRPVGDSNRQGFGVDYDVTLSRLIASMYQPGVVWNRIGFSGSVNTLR